MIPRSTFFILITAVISSMLLATPTEAGSDSEMVRRIISQRQVTRSQIVAREMAKRQERELLVEMTREEGESGAEEGSVYDFDVEGDGFNGNVGVVPVRKLEVERVNLNWGLPKGLFDETDKRSTDAGAERRVDGEL